MKLTLKIIFVLVTLVFTTKQWAQHQSKMALTVNLETQTIYVLQDLTYNNTTNDTLKSIVLNDWNNAYSDKKTPLAKRFSDEFYRPFHLAKNKDRGITSSIKLTDKSTTDLVWFRPENHPDLVVVQLNEPLLPNQKKTLHLSYTSKIPSNRFTGF